MASKRKRASEPPGPKKRPQHVVANVVILFVVSVFLYDIFMQTEHWPFSSHRMYSTLIGPTYVKEVIVMVTPEGELPLDADKHLYPFGRSRVAYAMRYLSRVPRGLIVDDALHSLARIYETNAKRYDEDWPEMEGLRMYRYQWQVLPDLSNLDYPQKVFLAEFEVQ